MKTFHKLNYLPSFSANFSTKDNLVFDDGVIYRISS